MIYDFPDFNVPIRQGDIFVGLPRVEVSLGEIPVISDDEKPYSTSWREIARIGQPVTAILPVCPVTAIVATQDCDTLRAPDITLCEIRKFQDVERKAAKTTAAKSWKNILTQHARINQKWFYLPPDDHIGFTEKQAVDFQVTLRVPRKELEDIRDLRNGRLNDIADEHFRERIADFFRRYPYDEWYALNPEELDAYQREYPSAVPFPWQHIVAPNDGT